MEEKHDEPKQKKGKGFKRGKAAMNARDRRKARRVAGREGALNEDIDQEERDNLVGAMTVSSSYLTRDRSSPSETVGPTSQINLCSPCHGENLNPGRRLGERDCLRGEGSNASERT